ncbi:MAG: hypothetical protein QOJ74_758, partial [Ilumatobacteraceae bacterium]|nr:hypothetical protein [Ilumatobacteraceae bacterium]
DVEVEVAAEAEEIAHVVPEPEIHHQPETEHETEQEPDSTVRLMREIHEVHEHDERDDARQAAPVVALFGGDDDDEIEDGDDAPRASVDDLFAKLRAARAEAVVERAQQDDAADTVDAAEASAGADAATAADLVVAPDITGASGASDASGISSTPDTAAVTVVVDATGPLTIVEDLSVFQATPEAPLVEEALDDTAFGQREASLTPIIVACARKLKRVLADEQNEILHTLRRNEPVRNIDTMLPWQTEQASRYAAAVQQDLEKAALVGAASIDGGTVKEHKADINRAGATKAAVEALTTSIVVPLRERLERAVTEAEGDNTELSTMVRGIYREWKTQRIDEHLDDVARAAFGRGALAAVVPGTKVCWMVDPNGPACPDAEDNALAGEVPAGQQFPTGHEAAPAHEGCRCMLALAPR